MNAFNKSDLATFAAFLAVVICMFPFLDFSHVRPAAVVSCVLLIAVMFGAFVAFAFARGWRV